MKVLAGTDTFDYGFLTIAKGYFRRISSPRPPKALGRTVFAECRSSTILHAMELDFETLTQSMAELDHTSAQCQWPLIAKRK